MDRIRTFKARVGEGSLNIDDVPATPLSSCTSAELESIASGITSRAKEWDGFGVSTVSKVIHRKRRSTVPILDRRAISGAYVDPHWNPTKAAKGVAPSQSQVVDTLALIANDLQLEANQRGWTLAKQSWQELQNIELFDVVWWSVWRDADLGVP